jgi:RNA polymerase sigma-70 factor (ECF subfamily)
MSSAESAAARAAFPVDDDQRHQAALDASFEEFFRESYPKIERFLWRLCNDRHLVDDAVQEAFITAQAKWEFVAQHEQPLFWVRKTARHKLMQKLEQTRSRAGVRLDDVPPERFTEPSDAREAQLSVLYLMRQLPGRQAAVLALVVDGSTDDEIARELGLAITTVRAYKAAARQKFKMLAEQAGYEAAARRRT